MMLIVCCQLLIACGGTEVQRPASPPTTLGPAPRGFHKAKVLEVIQTPDGPAVLLLSHDQTRLLPIIVGDSEAMSIKLRIERRRFARPLTHDLLDQIVGQLGGKVLKVHIDSLASGVFTGRVYLWTSTQIHELDARPSDAIALALGADAPVLVSDKIMTSVGLSQDDLDDITEPNAPEIDPPDGPDSRDL
jgi:bifunctional DNase/RNase